MVSVSPFQRPHLLGCSQVRDLHGLIAKHAAAGSFVLMDESLSYINATRRPLSTPSAVRPPCNAEHPSPALYGVVGSWMGCKTV